MFDNFITQCAQPNKVDWCGPNKIILDFGDVEGKYQYELLKGACDYLHKQIDIKLATSKEIYKKVNNLWGQLRDIQLERCLDRPQEYEQFSLVKNTVAYLTINNNVIVDINNFKSEERLMEFKDKHKEFNLELTTRQNTLKFVQDCKGGLWKFICYDKNTSVEQNEYTPIVILEMNFEKSLYRVYSGILIYKSFTIIPSLICNLDSDKLTDYIMNFDMGYFMEDAKSRAADLYQKYNEVMNSPIEISARELTSLFKSIGYKLELDDLDKVVEVGNMVDEDSNKQVQDFYNTFQFTTGETALDILKLSEFRKTFRYNKMTLLDVLHILSKEYLTYDGGKITVEVLGDIVYKLFDTKNVDRMQVKLLKNDQISMTEVM